MLFLNMKYFQIEFKFVFIEQTIASHFYPRLENPNIKVNVHVQDHCPKMHKYCLGHIL